MKPGPTPPWPTLSKQRALADRRVPTPTPWLQFPNLPWFKPNSSVYAEGETSTPPLIDLSEFPSLKARGAGDDHDPSAPPPSSKPYVGMFKNPTQELTEFTMSSEDFPALPGTSTWSNTAAVYPIPPHSQVPALEATDHKTRKSAKMTPSLQISSDGIVKNIPHTMIPNQFGIAGVLALTREAESNPNLVSLALGQDLTAVGLNLNSPYNLYATFAGPWTETPCRPQDIDYHVPPEYMINRAVREKLAPLQLNRYKEDLLFYLFYSFVGDAMQIAAAAELYNRDWRYHMEEKVWISQAVGMPIVEKTATYERGIYYLFDAENWRKVPKEFRLEYSKLEGRPQLQNQKFY